MIQNMNNKKILITAKDLFNDYNNSKYIVIDTRFSLFDSSMGQNEYKAGHLPGAIYVNLDEDLAGNINQYSGRHPLPSTDKLTQRFRDWGISNNSQVIVYDANNSAIAARLWWLLKWLGHEDVFILDGGIESWKKENYKLETSPSSNDPGDFQAFRATKKIWNSQLIESWLRDDIPFVLLDAREKSRFDGLNEPIDKIAGHIPMAINVPFADFLKPDGCWKKRDDIIKIWDEYNIDIGDSGEWGASCGSGVTACHLIISAILAGLPEPILYPGSWSEWITNSSRPIKNEY